ncbi:MAG: magnesium transporter [Patescibacteria group bacterium]|jgi:cation transporter-like permease|nr:magnesium transporter [Patescibacteria group bacterium]
MTRARRTFIFVAIAAGLASSLSLIGGIGLEYISNKFLPLIPLIIALPGLNDIVGDYASIIAAHTGDPTERKRSKKTLAISIFKVLVINVSALAIFSLILAGVRGYMITAGFLAEFLIFVFVAVGLTVAFMFIISHILDVILRKEKINPDELLIPVVTSIADIFMLIMVTIAVLTVF